MTRHLSPKRAALSLALALAIAALAPPAFAAPSKEMIQLMTQVQQLQDAVARLQHSNDETLGALKNLVEQSADSVNKMSIVVDGLQKQMRTQQDGTGAKLDQVSCQIVPLNDSVDEVKTRLNRIEKALQDIQGQQQSINAALQNLTTPAPAVTTPTPDAPGAGPAPTTLPPQAQQSPNTNRRAASTLAPDAVATVTKMPAAPLASDLYQTALSDYMSAKYSLASSEFGQVIHMYPDDSLSGNSYFYLGEIDRIGDKYTTAIKDYDRVLDQFPDNPKVPSAHLHKGMALLELKKNEAGIAELRALITRFPTSPEAALARSKLNGMSVPIVPKPRP